MGDSLQLAGHSGVGLEVSQPREEHMRGAEKRQEWSWQSDLGSRERRIPEKEETHEEEVR